MKRGAVKGLELESLEVWEDTGGHNKTSTMAFVKGGGGGDFLQKNDGKDVWSPKGP